MEERSPPNIEYLIILCFLYNNFFSFIKINIEVVRTRVRVWVRDYTCYPVGIGIKQNFNTLGLGIGMGMNFFCRDGYVIAKPVPALPGCHP